MNMPFYTQISVLKIGTTLKFCFFLFGKVECWFDSNFQISSDYFNDTVSDNWVCEAL